MNKKQKEAIEGQITKYSKIYNEIEQDLKDSDENKGRAWHVITMNKSRFCREILEDLKHIASLSEIPESDVIDSIISTEPCEVAVCDRRKVTHIDAITFKCECGKILYDVETER